MAAHSAGPSTGLQLNVESSAAEIKVRCSGTITAATKDTLVGQLHPLASADKTMVLDLGQVSYIDSTGLGALVGLWTTAKKAGGTVQMTNLPRNIKELLALTSLNTIFGC